MKPLKLTIEGINSFVQEKTVDFDNLSQNGIFCICGPTGSGKTTILDSVILALYAPSSHNRGYLKDYINAKCDKGKITLEFIADGVRYRVYRELRRNSSSAARLTDMDTGEVLADRADTVTDAIKKMLKLDKDDFTKVVVLEQGKYADFMSMGKAKRYETVAKLFNLERFDVLKDKVNEAKRKYEGELEKIKSALAEHEEITETALTALKKEKKTLQKELEEANRAELAATQAVQAGEQLRQSAQLREKAVRDCKDANDALAEIAKRKEIAAQRQQALVAESERVESLRKESEAANILLHLARECDDDEETVTQKEKRRTQLREEYAKYNGELQNYMTLCEKLFVRENELRDSIGKEQAKCNDARQSYENARQENAAALVRLSIKEGDVCPVCGGKYHGDAHAAPVVGEKEIATHKAAWEKSEKTLATYNDELQKTIQSRATVEGQKAATQVKLDTVTAEGKRIADEVKALREKIAARLDGKTPAAVREQVKSAAETYERAKKAWEQNGETLKKLKEDIAAGESGAQEKLASANHTLAALPPTAFAAQAFETAREALQKCKERVGELTEKSGGVSAQIDSFEERLQKKKSIKEKQKATADILDNVLRLYACTNKDRLFSFVAEQYMQSFTAAGGETLFALTNGKYTLAYEDGDFYVSDFFADNARRKVKTLSGGEMFLASMSIAMAISREIAAQQNYEFFFLDEGFGTLDERAIETVTEALISLSRDTVVGIVTHRTELADRIAARLNVIPATEDKGSDLLAAGV